MPKRKSGQQVPKVWDGQGNLMLDAKQGVARSNRAGLANFCEAKVDPEESANCALWKQFALTKDLKLYEAS